jgi:deoxyribodipyrimidine photolyase
MNKKKLVIYWSRRDFRLRDNAALSAAVRCLTKTLQVDNAQQKNEVFFLPLFIVEPYMTQADPKHQFGTPSRLAISQMLPEFAKNFFGFYLAHSHPVSFFKDLYTKIQHEYNIEIYVNEDVHPDFYSQLKKIKESGYTVHLCRDQLTVNRNTKTGSGNLYSVFTPFKNSVWLSFVQEKESDITTIKDLQECGIQYFKLNNLDLKLDTALVTSANSTLTASFFSNIFSKNESIKVGNNIIDLQSVGLPQRNLEFWYTSEDAAQKLFCAYLSKYMVSYKEDRDSLGNDATSKMSFALAWGLMSARTMVVLIKEYFKDPFENPFSNKSPAGPTHYISELIWREFYKYLYFHKPQLIDQEFQEKFRGRVKWAPDVEALNYFMSWIKGETGYKIVDAAMMQLAKTGWMHNRARMIVASVLTKNLGVDWRWGQEYFRAMLLDIDESSNIGGWQWGASVGSDPKPIRIFNPYLQAKNYDPDGIYQKKWLGAQRWLKDSVPIVPHAEARDSALKRYGLDKEEHLPVRDY